jgi:hypothetical protein
MVLLEDYLNGQVPYWAFYGQFTSPQMENSVAAWFGVKNLADYVRQTNNSEFDQHPAKQDWEALAKAWRQNVEPRYEEVTGDWPGKAHMIAIVQQAARKVAEFELKHHNAPTDQREFYD